MSLLLKSLTQNYLKTTLLKATETSSLFSCRNLSIVPDYYDGEDPAPKFFSPNLQALLNRLTRPDYNRVFRKRTDGSMSALPAPKYKFLTSEELELEVAKAEKKAKKLLKMPPVVQIHKPIDEILSKDPALLGNDDATFLFTDISFGVNNAERFIIQREPDGTLRYCDHDVRKRLNQVYFPIRGRKIREPLMFTDEEKFNNLLERDKYEFVLDRACIQYEPDEPTYHKITSIAYQHLDINRKYELLRSTRHFGPLVFYLTWHQNIDGLMLELIQNTFIREAVLLIGVRQSVRGDVTNHDVVAALITQMLSTPVQLKKLEPEQITEEDIQLDNKCLQCIENYVASNSTMKSQQELALQGFREYYQQLVDLSRGLKKAHGAA